MRATTLLLGLAASVSSNIVFTHVPLSCNLTDPRIYNGCLRGQDCNVAGQCVPTERRDSIHYSTFRPEAHEVQVRDGPYSTDGSCGPAHGNTICDPNSKVYTGGCCSQYGWCGNSADHCGTGCISGCTSIPPPTSSGVAPRADGQCGAVSLALP
ncbi:hypothetical protein ONS96_001139 [Cadophora gregata f. sp. sojae]|nr:hypothetical protein ONS96_001139 [Cadophora gregata f. sp. sojae]